MKIDFDQIRELLAVFSQTDISELTIESGEEKITVRKQPPVVAQHATTALIEVPQAQRLAAPVQQFVSPSPAPPPPEPAKVQAAPEPKSNGLVPITSPMVGTFYRSPSPSAPPFIDIGDRISVGQTVCIIEAMKLMNDMPAEVSGKIVKVCVENGTTVEYGQPLFMVDPIG